MLVATFFVSVCVAEISFPESILTFTDQEWLIDLWPKAYRYNIQVGLCALVIGGALIVPAFKIQKDFATLTSLRFLWHSTSFSRHFTWNS